MVIGIAFAVGAVSKIVSPLWSESERALASMHTWYCSLAKECPPSTFLHRVKIMSTHQSHVESLKRSSVCGWLECNKTQLGYSFTSLPNCLPEGNRKHYQRCHRLFATEQQSSCMKVASSLVHRPSHPSVFRLQY